MHKIISNHNNLVGAEEGELIKCDIVATKGLQNSINGSYHLDDIKY